MAQPETLPNLPGPPRKVIQINAVMSSQVVLTSFTAGILLFALCSDGSIWFSPLNDPKWTQLPSPPE